MVAPADALFSVGSSAVVAESSPGPARSSSAALTRAGGLLLVEGYLDGTAAPALFIVDTGAPGLLVHGEVDATSATGTLAGATGRGYFRAERYASLRVGALHQTDLAGLVVDLSGLREALELPVAGVIGYAQLAAAPFRFDLRQNRLHVGPTEPGKTDEQLNAQAYGFELRGHLPVLRATVGDTDLDLAFDTGSGVNVLAREHLARLRGHLRGRPATRRLAGLDDHPREVPCALVRLTLLDEEAHRDRAFLFADLEAFDYLHARDGAVSGLLGPDFWEAPGFEIDFESRRLTFFAPERATAPAPVATPPQEQSRPPLGGERLADK